METGAGGMLRCQTHGKNPENRPAVTVTQARSGGTAARRPWCCVGGARGSSNNSSAGSSSGGGGRGDSGGHSGGGDAHRTATRFESDGDRSLKKTALMRSTTSAATVLLVAGLLVSVSGPGFR